MRKKFKKIVASTLALTMMFTSSALIDALNAKADENTAVEIQFSEALGLNLNPDTNKRILSELTELNNGKTPEIKMNDNGFIKYIDGNLSDKEVHSENDALNVLADISPILGINDVNKELVFEKVNEDKYVYAYRFIQRYKGLDVVNTNISLIVDKKTHRAELLNSMFVPNIQIDIIPDISDSKVKEIVEEKYSIELSTSPELVVFSRSNDSSYLAWNIETGIFAPSLVYIDAENGEVLYEEMPKNLTSNEYIPVEYEVKNNDFTSEIFSVDISEIKSDNDEKQYTLYDTKRNIKVLDSSKYYLNYRPKGVYEKGTANDIIDTYDKHFIVTDDKEIENFDMDLLVLHNVQKVDDFYSDLGFDLNNLIYVISRIYYENNSPYDNASYMRGKNQRFLVFGARSDEHSRGEFYDIVAHEYTHYVTTEKIGFKGINILDPNGPDSEEVAMRYYENGAIEEAYSDIMAEYADGTDEWIMGDGAPFSRDLKDPRLGVTKNSDSHSMANNVSHVSYLMHEYKIPDDLAIDIWYTSMSIIPKDANYNDCRKAVINAAEIVLENNSNKEEYINIIKKSFNEVRIFGDGYLYADSNADGKHDVDDLYYLHNFLIGNVEFEKEIQNSNSDLNYDGIVNNTDLSLMLKIESIDKSDIIGDVNADGEVNIDDLNTLDMHLTGQDGLKTTLQFYNADLYCNGRVDVYDLILLRKKMITIITQPQNVTAKIGDTVNTGVEAIGEELSYQWYEKNPGETSFTRSSINIASYNASMTAEMNGREIYCEITDKYNNSVQSETATLYMGNPLTITNQPINTSAEYGNEAKVRVSAKGDGLTYKWYYKNKGDSKFYYTKTFDNKTTYSAEMNEARDGRQVYCEITDKYGDTIQTEIVTLGLPVAITENLVNTAAELGEKVKLSVSATGHGLTYEWHYKNMNMKKFDVTKYFTTNTYTLNEMTEARAGREVYCVITDIFGNSVQTETVTIGLPVEIIEQPVNTSAEYGSEAKVRVTAKGDDLTYKWYYKNKNESKFYYTKTFDNMTTYSAEMNESRDGRQIYCEITDKYGVTIQTEIVTIGLPVEITEDLVDITAKLGEKVEFSVSATGHGLTYKWYFKNKNMKNFEVTETFKTNNYGFDQITPARAGREVYCEITDIFGNTEKTETIKIDLPTGYGDANCDGELTIDDADAIMKAYANPSRYGLTEQGMINADVSGEGDVTLSDALLIQQYFAN